MLPVTPVTFPPTRPTPLASPLAAARRHTNPVCSTRLSPSVVHWRPDRRCALARIRGDRHLHLRTHPVSGARRPDRRAADGTLPAARVSDGSRGGCHRRKRLLVATFTTMSAASGTMLVVTAADAATYAAAAAMVMVSGAFWTTDMPVRRRLLVDAVAPESVSAALGFDNATMYATRALGPLIGGAIYQEVGISGIYALIATSYLVCLGLATRVSAQSGAPQRRHTNCPRQAQLSAAAAGACSRSTLPDHHGGDARL